MPPDTLNPKEFYDPDKHGLLDPGFRYADGLSALAVRREAERFESLSEAQRHRLVEAAKSPTVPPRALVAKQNAFHAMTRVHNQGVELMAQTAVGPCSLLADRESRQQVAELSKITPTDASGSQTIIEFREWSDEYRIRTQVATTYRSQPPDQSGERSSDMLSERGARKIAESCMYMADVKGGFSTFVTGTFDEAARERVESGESTIQNEVTRTMDGLQQLYRRGWTTPDGERIEGHGEALPYCWVVEVPENDEGKLNPHVHMMIGWSVEYHHFKAWAARIESIWGNGYFHLEKIKDPLCAGAYMAKAAGYMTKAQGKTDQGVVKGNRYAISSTARAPGWEVIGAYALGVMGCIIWDLHHKLQRKHAALFAERKRLSDERERVRQGGKEAQDKHPEKRYPLTAKRRLEAIGARLTAVRRRIHDLPVRASKYQLWIKRPALSRFIGYAHAHGWSFEARPDSLWLAEFKRRRKLRQRLAGAWKSIEEIWQWQSKQADYKAEALGQWDEYEAWGVCQ